MPRVPISKSEIMELIEKIHNKKFATEFATDNKKFAIHSKKFATNIKIVQPKNGSMIDCPRGINVHITWASPLHEGTLKASLDSADITSYLKIDNAKYEAKGLVPFSKIGMFTIIASGEFLLSLPPLRMITLSAESTFSTSPG